MKFLDRVRLAFNVILGERRFHVSESPPGWIEALSGWATATGLDVSPEKALESTAVLACVRVLAEGVAQLPLITYRRLSEDAKERATDHNIYDLLHLEPNPEMSSFQFRETLMGHLTTWGNAYAEIEYNRGGGINALWPLRPDRMKVERRDGQLRYAYRLPDEFGSTVVFADSQILHVRGLGNNGIVGYSPIQLARQSISLGMATEEFGARFFANDARPGIVLEHPGELGEKAFARLRKSWESAHGGLQNAHRVAILEEGLSIKEIGIPPEDAQFLQTRKFQINDVARIYRVPPHMIGDLDRATFSNIEQQSLEFVIYTLMPWLVRWEQELSRSLLLPSERGDYFVEHLVDGLLRGDTASRYQAYSIGRQWGWLSANDVRRLENMNPVKGGDTYLIPLNMIPASDSGFTGSLEQGPPPEVEDDARAIEIEHARNQARLEAAEQRARGFARERQRLAMAHLRLYQDVAARVLRREANDVGNAARKYLTRRDRAEFDRWLDDFYTEHREFVFEQFRPLAMAYGDTITAAARAEVDEPQEMTPEIEDWIRNYLETFAARHCAINEARVRTVLRQAADRNEEPLETLEEELDLWPEKRGQRTAMWESFRFNNALAMAIYIGANRREVRWVAFGKSCPYCNDLDGQVVGITRPFLPAGEDYQPQGAERPLHVRHDVGHAPAHEGCDCMTVSA